MKNPFFIIISSIYAGIATAAFTSCSVTSHTETAQGVNFSNFKTFAWSGNGKSTATDRTDNDIVDNNIKNSISQQLEKKGWVETNDHPDVVLDYMVAVKKQMRHETEGIYAPPVSRYIYSRHGLYNIWYPSMLVGYHSYNIPFREGELTVNMVDAKTNKLIWQGWAEGDLGGPSLTTKEVTADVKSIFKKFNYPVS
jgi:hypothetical protein